MADSKIQVDGRLSKDPELKQGKTKEFCRFSLAVDNDDGDGTTWYNVTAFGGLGKLAAARIKKGHEVRVKGRLQVREYTKNDGGTGVSNDIIADAIILEGGVKLDKFTPAQAAESKSQEDVDPTPDNDQNGGSDEIPF